MFASAMQAADATIANVALPQLERDLGDGGVAGAWVVTSYLCATAVAAPLTGWLRRRYGARRLFAGVVGAFAIASLLCALAPSLGTIILFRILQGAGGGVIHPLAQAILLDLYPKERHGRMLAAWGAAIMLGPILGPVLGGVVTDLASWRVVFLINLPLAVFAIWAMCRALPETETTADAPADLLGIALLAIGIGGLQLFLARSVGRPWLQSPELLVEGAAAVIAFAALAMRAQRTRFAALRPAVFTDVNFAVAAFYNFTISALLFVAIVFVPALTQGPLGYSATVAGLTIVPRGIAAMLVMLLVGRLIGRIAYRILLAGAMMLMTVGLAMLSAVEPSNALPWIVIGSTLQASGGGMMITCLSAVGFSTLNPDMRTDAAGVYSLLRQLGCASGVALMTAVLQAQLATNVAELSAGAAGPVGTIMPHVGNLFGLQAYNTSFAGMALASLIIMPGILLFRIQSLRRQVEDPV
jgi:MFS transporter, DHA2 family, multidrug resistance protein